MPYRKLMATPNGITDCCFNKLFLFGGRHSSMVSSAPTILWPQVWIPSTQSMLFSICIEIVTRKEPKLTKRGRYWPFFLKKMTHQRCLISVLLLFFSRKFPKKNAHKFQRKTARTSRFKFPNRFDQLTVRIVPSKDQAGGYNNFWTKAMLVLKMVGCLLLKLLKWWFSLDLQDCHLIGYRVLQPRS